MPTLWDPAALQGLLERLERLSPENRAQWGTMHVAQALAHMRLAMQMGMGHLPVKPRPSPLRWKVVRYLVIHVFPFPKGAPTAPEILGSGAEEFESERQLLAETMVRFVAAGAAGSLGSHPAFGDISTHDWGVLQWRHVDHHLRQFGA